MLEQGLASMQGTLGFEDYFLVSKFRPRISCGRTGYASVMQRANCWPDASSVATRPTKGITHSALRMETRLSPPPSFAEGPERGRNYRASDFLGGDEVNQRLKVWWASEPSCKVSGCHRQDHGLFRFATAWCWCRRRTICHPKLPVPLATTLAGQNVQPRKRSSNRERPAQPQAADASLGEWPHGFIGAARLPRSQV